MRWQLCPHSLTSSLSSQIRRRYWSHLAPDRVVRICDYAFLHLIFSWLNCIGSYSFFQIRPNHFLDLAKVILSHLIEESVMLSLLFVDSCACKRLLRWDAFLNTRAWLVCCYRPLDGAEIVNSQRCACCIQTIKLIIPPMIDECGLLPLSLYILLVIWASRWATTVIVWW